MSKSRLLLAVVIPAMLIAAPLSAKTLVFCSEGSPEKFLSRHQHHRHVVRRQQPDLQPHRRLRARHHQGHPGLAEKWDISADGKVYTFHLRKGVKWHSTPTSSRPATLNADDIIFAIERQWKRAIPISR